ncbi:putative G-protein coupled receptor 160 [Phascolarctos cinereus]|uniref:Probable G-protein coupled receptor 160 n=1 Tax=Phascolarctos cinereus TaxID=38626 RepID=A0A6P5JRI3_PHACI|nr:probable G-protein coupled receptor 160 [Phascolarctos cinereus]XP_020835955.1 probable G-protein coupled receptor 160 [Phascolarctos cinereus]XP_020835958.1 probable G-protein coupled receptor 160 [Phascolarctos cinereus]XP_020835965.1 probable G-protein coupled receptor 160 [Phascolarctos cinereus]XP_020835966.1 probable G-protein coupled receptor 160 [Phascolarctos cinereus]XP_020835970.1 probable G-protein coupled receptor 160 [Phascolarctos cinereus]XP_020835973.1 probable G-protein c
MFVSLGNHTFQPQSHPGHPSLDPSCMVLLVILVKTFLNILMIAIGRKDTHQSFLEYFCVSVALIDFLLLGGLSFIAYFQDFALWGIRFTKYHICLLPQIMSFACGFLHCPVFLLAGLDHYLNISQTSKVSRFCRNIFYFFSVIFIWIAALVYVLGDPVINVSLSKHGLSSYQCPFYVSIQSYWLSVSMVGVLLVVFGTCWSEVPALIRSLRIASYMNETALYFPLAPDWDHMVICKKQLLIKLLICFLGTWFPFVFLQIIILFLDIRIPAYVEMNVPWLYFVNSFLIATVYWFRSHELKVTETVLYMDPFVSWKFCFIPFTIHHMEQMGKAEAVTVC